LQHWVPANPLNGRRDEFGTNVSLAEVFPVHAALFACWQKPQSLGFGCYCCVESAALGNS